ncbi:MAG: multidrug effflux MFS transporter [Pseudoruegeria sp.]
MARTPPHLGTLIAMTSMAVLTLNMFLPSLASIAEDLNTSYATVNLSIAGYLAITAVLQILLGPLSDRYGRRPILLICLTLFSVASLGCALAPTIEMFLAARFLQTVSVACVVISRAIVRDQFAPSEAASKLGYIGMIMAIAPITGPMLGGVIEEVFGWRGSFWMFCALGLALTTVVYADLGETNTTKDPSFAAQFRAYPDLLRSGPFWGYSLCQAFSVGAFYAFLGGVPLVGKMIFALSATQLGALLGWISIGFLCGSFFAGRFGKRIPLDSLLLIGRVVATSGMALGLLIMMFQPPTIGLFMGAIFFIGIGNGITLPGAASGAMSVRPDLAGGASGLSGALMVGCGALMTWITGELIGQNPSVRLLVAMMLLSTVLSLIAALYVYFRSTDHVPHTAK